MLGTVGGSYGEVGSQRIEKWVLFNVKDERQTLHIQRQRRCTLIYSAGQMELDQV